jgi:hypothetical protein
VGWDEEHCSADWEGKGRRDGRLLLNFEFMSSLAFVIASGAPTISGVSLVFLATLLPRCILRPSAVYDSW